ncbi:phytanoyl-CoA dioxygenase family protein [Paenibacillus sp. J5C_2022]|uniref:phytanoyl-CoA dioxygenase family protein n=1 Tax=Paenibacillus sp. J5C2022 TaxID=2977129 RepID=UPI0021D3236F|nr:phytanoyl-CoA dioxygenase family protein [Paenibacillus sp. J5C2022]MCU6710833.1 phytanoyl-CoA dioxygenase family protein [Paenibacillus sp. J5C2022]
MSVASYPHVFDKTDLEGIRACNEQHGFAIVKGMLPQEIVDRLKAEVEQVLAPTFTAGSKLTMSSGNFVESSPTLVNLMTYEPFMAIVRHLHDNESMTLNRSAAIYKKAGASGMFWHTDWEPKVHPYRANAVLNTTGAFSCWFYLTGSHPTNAGLAIIPDSHTEDWPGPEGFAFTRNRTSFHRVGTEPVAYAGMDVPGMMPIVSEPGDLVIFAERTYHGVNDHHGTESRLSCGLSFRKRSHAVGEHWPLPESAKRFIASVPAEVRHLAEDYIGIDSSWVSGS